MTPAEANPYGERVEAVDVQYEPAVYDATTDALTPPYYFRASDGRRVCFVNPRDAVSVAPNGYFALWIGPDEEYAPVVSA